MEVIVERRVAIILLRTVNHHRPVLVVVAESQVVMVDGVKDNALIRGVVQKDAEGDMVGNQQLLHRHHKALRLGANHFPALLTEMKHGLVLHTAKHIDLIAHHADTAFKVNARKDIGNHIVGAVGAHAGKHRLLVGGVHQHLVLETAQDRLLEILLVIEQHRVDGVFRMAQVQGVVLRKDHVCLLRRNLEARPVGASSFSLPTVVVKIEGALCLFDYRLVFL